MQHATNRVKSGPITTAYLEHGEGQPFELIRPDIRQQALLGIRRSRIDREEIAGRSLKNPRDRRWRKRPLPLRLKLHT